MTVPLRLETCLAADDARCVRTVLQKLASCGLAYAVTGGMALELGLRSLGRLRPFNDIDVVVASFDTLPPALGAAFMVSHAHANRPVGKLALQLVDPEQRVRIDVFTACGDTFARARPAWIGDLQTKVVTLEDVASRIASELMGFCQGDAVPPKYADDHLRARRVVDSDAVERAWREQRRRTDPSTYADAAKRIDQALRQNTGRFEATVYSTDTDSVCPHCLSTEHFKLAARRSVLAILGYC